MPNDPELQAGLATRRAALNNGVAPEELQEIFLHASVYYGFPAAVDAFRNAAEVIEAK